RIYINRSLRLDKINSIGFDMDATLAIYNSPQSEELAFILSINRLVDIGYPEELRETKYQADFVARNAWFDKKFGMLLKTDEHCNILSAFHGFRKLQKKEIRRLYPNKHVALDESRIYVLNTVFNVPEALLLAAVVNYFNTHEDNYTALTEETGFKRRDKNQVIPYSTIFNDCRSAIDWIHTEGDFKETITNNINAYIAKDSRAVQMMQKLSQDGKKLFLLTNSPWKFTNALMSHVMGSRWRELFDVVIVDGNKPKWFLQDIPFKEIDITTGATSIGVHSGPLTKGEVYSGGCASEFKHRMNLHGKDILYVGDHIFGDVLKSKKVGGWRTLLIVPELSREMKASVSNFDLDIAMIFPCSETIVGIHSNVFNTFHTTLFFNSLSPFISIVEAEFGAMGSMLRCGWRQTHFAAQLRKYADLYTSNVYNLHGYSSSHYFSSSLHLLPHEEGFLRVVGCNECSSVNEQEHHEPQATPT
ncbi:hypothetical protein Angca_002863, partial [Angiostrongylus cantonensis]